MGAHAANNPWMKLMGIVHKERRHHDSGSAAAAASGVQGSATTGSNDRTLNQLGLPPLRGWLRLVLRTPENRKWQDIFPEWRTLIDTTFRETRVNNNHLKGETLKGASFREFRVELPPSWLSPIGGMALYRISILYLIVLNEVRHTVDAGGSRNRWLAHIRCMEALREINDDGENIVFPFSRAECWVPRKEMTLVVLLYVTTVVASRSQICLMEKSATSSLQHVFFLLV
ncbi:hypothetical protein WN51_07813 [Melipona quadrifasciata]|uniref:Uncharacterized protein n=1 Tax=Melipona quadrifasciata TaxID=166423 RepID=A0A0M9A840_9HYME|nr:hypothetical protein WN51_07813 [Melipona quadrifasciata]